MRKKTHASSPSTSGKTHEKTCPIQTRRLTRESIPQTPGLGFAVAWIGKKRLFRRFVNDVGITAPGKMNPNFPVHGRVYDEFALALAMGS